MCVVKPAAELIQNKNDSYKQALGELKNMLQINIKLAPSTRPDDLKALLELLHDMQDKS